MESIKNHQIFRFTFSDGFKEELFRFSKINQYIERKQFKENWNEWVAANRLLVDDELNRLTELKYDGDIEDKMFKSARYYFRKKSESIENKNKPRRKYSAISKELLTQIDNYIRNSLTKDDYQPKNTFEKFCLDKENHALIRESIRNIREKDPSIELSEIENKIKKTYKNRYSLIIK